MPTVWDTFSDEPTLARDNTPNIYNSMTQKLRKERGQNLENFVQNFMQSIEPNADVGEDVVMMNDTKSVPKPPGRNFVFGDLFELKYHPKYFNQTVQVHSVRGPSQCLIYICKFAGHSHSFDDDFKKKSLFSGKNTQHSDDSGEVCHGADKYFAHTYRWND